MKQESFPPSGSRQKPRRVRTFATPARHRGKLALLAAIAIAGLSSCASSTREPPPAGRALIDATPDHGRRDRIEGIQLVSVNGIRTHGTETTLTPGRNTVRVGFHWPQGGSQEVDLAFHAVAGSTYIIQYEVFPPYANRMREATDLERKAADFGGLAPGSGEAAILLVPPAIAIWGAGLVKRRANEAAERQKPAHYIDLMVVCRQNAEGIVRRVRAYPDGRVDAAPWAAHAQMKAPR